MEITDKSAVYEYKVIDFYNIGKKKKLNLK